MKKLFDENNWKNLKMIVSSDVTCFYGEIHVEEMCLDLSIEKFTHGDNEYLYIVSASLPRSKKVKLSITNDKANELYNKVENKYTSDIKKESEIERQKIMELLK